MSFVKERKRKWIISYDLEIDGKKEEDLEHTLTAVDIVEAITAALNEIYSMVVLRTSDLSSSNVDIWDVCEVES